MLPIETSSEKKSELPYDTNNSLISNIWNGVKWSTVAFPLKIITFGVIHCIANRFFPMKAIQYAVYHNKIKTLDLVYPIIIGPLLEEMTVRFGIQNGLEKIQNAGKGFVPNWITTPKVRIVATGIIFASLHLMGGPLISTAASISRVTFLIFFPVESILFEKFGFISAFTAHATHNILALIAGKHIIAITKTL